MFATAGTQIRAFLTNSILLACISSWFCAQFIKTVIGILYGKIHSVPELVENLLWKTGGLPSSHTALVAALCTTIAFDHGISSDIFILSLMFLMVTVRDSVGVRRSSGVQARQINKLGRSLEEKGIIEYKPIKEVMGHTPMEVVVGGLLGMFIGLAYSLF
ncbi:MAG: divergent PAP2 family protein [Treponemataceae bacterium]|nr:divergent PAP2 family protein [Treponemataceae bacterium]